MATMTSRRGATAWIIGGTALAVLSISWGTFNAVGALAFDRQHFTRTLHGSVLDISVKNDAGRVHIIAGNRADGNVVVVGKGVRGLTKPEHHESLRDGHLVITSKCPLSLSSICSMNLTVSVPDGAPITLRASGGSAIIDGATAAVDADSSGGGVRVNGARGVLHLTSSGGGVTARGVDSSKVDASSSGGGVKLVFTTPPTDVHVSSSGGGVTIELPNTGDAYRVDVGSSGGSANNQVNTSNTSRRVIDAHSSGGAVTVRYRP